MKPNPDTFVRVEHEIGTRLLALEKEFERIWSTRNMVRDPDHPAPAAGLLAASMDYLNRLTLLSAEVIRAIRYNRKNESHAHCAARLASITAKCILLGMLCSRAEMWVAAMDQIDAQIARAVLVKNHGVMEQLRELHDALLIPGPSSTLIDDVGAKVIEVHQVSGEEGLALLRKFIRGEPLT